MAHIIYCSCMGLITPLLVHFRLLAGTVHHTTHSSWALLATTGMSSTGLFTADPSEHTQQSQQAQHSRQPHVMGPRAKISLIMASMLPASGCVAPTLPYELNCAFACA
eukprot:scaffold20852_cov23-Tisochrysis_lutea.AAC.1